MAILMGLPNGFPEAVKVIHTFPQDIFGELCRDVLLYLQSRRGPVNVSQLVEKLEEADVKSSRESVNSAIDAIVFVFRSSARCNATPDQLADELNKSLLWDTATVSVMKHLWNEQGKLLNTSASQFLNVGKLIDMRWKLGMAMSSESCKNINSTFVTITLKIASSSGEVTTKAFEMTISEFQNFSKQMKEMSSMLDTA